MSFIVSAISSAFILARRLVAKTESPPNSFFAAFTLVHWLLTLSDEYTSSKFSLLTASMQNYLSGNFILPHFFTNVNTGTEFGVKTLFEARLMIIIE